MHIHKKATIPIHLTNLFMFGEHIKHIHASNSSASLKTYFPRYNLYYFLLFFAIVFASAHKRKHKHNCVFHPKMVKKSRDHVFYNFRGLRGRTECSGVVYAAVYDWIPFTAACSVFSPWQWSALFCL